MIDEEIYMEPRIHEIEGNMLLDILCGGRVAHTTGRKGWDYWAGESRTWTAEYEDDDTVGFLTAEQAQHAGMCSLTRAYMISQKTSLEAV